jgi:hypothetical protein
VEGHVDEKERRGSLGWHPREVLDPRVPPRPTAPSRRCLTDKAGRRGNQIGGDDAADENVMKGGGRRRGGEQRWGDGEVGRGRFGDRKSFRWGFEVEVKRRPEMSNWEMGTWEQAIVGGSARRACGISRGWCRGFSNAEERPGCKRERDGKEDVEGKEASQRRGNNKTRWRC